MNQGGDANAPSTDEVNGLVDVVRRLRANEPHVRCQAVEGPLAPLAAELDSLAVNLDARRTEAGNLFGVEVLVAQSPIMMMACDAEERIRFLNYNVPGMSPADVIGKSFYFVVLPEEHERVRAMVRRVLETGEPQSYEIRSVVAAGAEWYAVKLGPIRSGEKIVGFTVSVVDVTDLKRTQLRLEQSNRELENFASVASHDLQEPLRKIQTFSERLTATCATVLSPEGRDYLERMNNAASRMRTLIDDLLAYSRVSSRAQPFVRVNLQQIARDVVSDLELAIEQLGARVTIGELPMLEADPSQMRQLLQNLLSNALKFHREGVAPVISIQGSTDAEGRHAELRVEDNGIGFDVKYLDRIFALFQRLHGRGKYEGTGIGLAICRKIAERHGGSIGARSNPGQGSTFIVTLPARQNQSR